MHDGGNQGRFATELVQDAAFDQHTEQNGGQDGRDSRAQDPGSGRGIRGSGLEVALPRFLLEIARQFARCLVEGVMPWVEVFQQPDIDFAKLALQQRGLHRFDAIVDQGLACVAQAGNQPCLLARINLE